MFKKLSALLCLSLLTVVSFAQQVIPCATDELHVQQSMVDPMAKIREEKANEYVRQQMNTFNKTANGIVYIPVVFHIIYNSAKDSSENISQYQIMDQIRILNEDFRRKENTLGFSTDPASADLKIEFRLAQYDPNGNKHDGIIRVNSSLTSDARDNVKALSYWDSNKYLNVWVVKSINAGFSAGKGIVLGYAQFPWDRASKPTTDGVVVRSDQIGAIGSGQTSQAGRTLTHEIGHWLGLYHTFQGSCSGGTSSNCASQGDQVCDTPPVAESSSGCAVGQNSCSSDVPDLPDMVRNYMDYSDGNCMNTYTAGQKTRVYGFLPLYRNGIYGNGTNDISYAGIGGDGNYLTVPASPFTAPVEMGFEGTTFADAGWKTNNFGNPLNGWQVNNTVSYSGNSSMYMRNYTNTTEFGMLAKINSRDGFQSREVNLSLLAAPFVEFQYAYAQRSSASNDSLVLIISNDFGMSEERIFAKTAADLSTAGVVTSEFIPTREQWKKVSINLSAYRSFTHARFRFEFVNRRGNNVYVDDFKLTNWAAGIEDYNKESVNFRVFPNPMKETSTLSFDLQESGKVNIHLYDVAGKEISALADQNFSAGKQELTISSSTLKPGIYIIRFESNGAAFSHKLLIN